MGRMFLILVCVSGVMGRMFCSRVCSGVMGRMFCLRVCSGERVVCSVLVCVSGSNGSVCSGLVVCSGCNGSYRSVLGVMFRSNGSYVLFSCVFQEYRVVCFCSRSVFQE